MIQIQTCDMHTGGEPVRIITGGLPEIPGTTVLERRRYFREHLDHIRTGLMWEPRGHATRVSGKAYYTGEHTFIFDPEDPLIRGFILR